MTSPGNPTSAHSPTNWETFRDTLNDHWDGAKNACGKTLSNLYEALPLLSVSSLATGGKERILQAITPDSHAGSVHDSLYYVAQEGENHPYLATLEVVAAIIKSVLQVVPDVIKGIEDFTLEIAQGNGTRSWTAIKEASSKILKDIECALFLLPLACIGWVVPEKTYSLLQGRIEDTETRRLRRDAIEFAHHQAQYAATIRRLSEQLAAKGAEIQEVRRQLATTAALGVETSQAYPATVALATKVEVAQRRQGYAEEQSAAAAAAREAEEIRNLLKVSGLDELSIDDFLDFISAIKIVANNLANPKKYQEQIEAHSISYQSLIKKFERRKWFGIYQKILAYEMNKILHANGKEVIDGAASSYFSSFCAPDVEEHIAILEDQDEERKFLWRNSMVNVYKDLKLIWKNHDSFKGISKEKIDDVVGRQRAVETRMATPARRQISARISLGRDIPMEQVFMTGVTLPPGHERKDSIPS